MNKLGDVGLGVGAGFIDDAVGAEVQDCVHSHVPFDSFFAVKSASATPTTVTGVAHVTTEANIDHDTDTTCLSGLSTVFQIPLGHDGWTEGDEACVLLDFGGLSGYALSAT